MNNGYLYCGKITGGVCDKCGQSGNTTYVRKIVVEDNVILREAKYLDLYCDLCLLDLFKRGTKDNG